VEARHPLGSPKVEPIGSGRDYAMDAKRARQLEPLVKEGHADSLVEAGIRFVIAHKGISTVLVGYSTFEHFEYAAKATRKGPLKGPALERMAELQAGFAGDAR
jgi:L-galactose dehydrogenase/L-glyceraldehyde 3-phosphate reductase